MVNAEVQAGEDDHADRPSIPITLAICRGRPGTTIV